MDRRTTIKWVVAASAVWPLFSRVQAGSAPTARGVGTDPNLLPHYRVGELWPLTLTVEQRALASILSDIIIPTDEHSPSASAVGVVDFIDEWVSAPYSEHQRDQKIILDGLAWMDAEALRRFHKLFKELGSTAQATICDTICTQSPTGGSLQLAVSFFALFRDLTAGGFYSTPVGRNDLNYVGNKALERFDGPPLELLKTLGLQ